VAPNWRGRPASVASHRGKDRWQLNIAPYNLDIARTCSFIVNVASDMCEQWIADGKPDADKFSWTPSDRCPITGPWFPLYNWRFAGPFWSSFTPRFDTTSEPGAGVL
jgi:hypothetical protein